MVSYIWSALTCIRCLYKRLNALWIYRRVLLPERFCRSSRPEEFLGNSVLKICSEFTGEHPCRSVISIKMQSNFIEIALRHGCSPVNLLHIFRTPFLITIPLDGCFWFCGCFINYEVEYFPNFKTQF